MPSQKLGEASVDIVVDLAKYKRQLEKAGKITKRVADRMVKTLDRVGKKLVSVGKSLTTKLTLPMALAGAGIARVGSQFDLSLSRIEGLVGVNRKQIDAWRNDLLDMAPVVGKTVGELAEGLFFVTSAGLRGSAAMDLLKKSAMAAAAGLGETKVVADAASSAINAYGAENLTAGEAVGILVGTVREGKAEASAIAGVMGQVLPIAQNLGVGFDQVGASIAAMTRIGLPAEEAVTSLKATLNSLLKTTPDAANAIEDIGLNLGDLRETLRERGGLLTVLEQLKGAVDNTDVEITRIFPNIRALVGVLGLVGKDAEATRKIFDNLAVDGLPTLNKAFGVVEKENAFKFDQAMARINSTLVRLADVLLPILTPIIEGFGKAIESLGKKFAALSDTTKTWIVIISGVMLSLGPAILGIGLLTLGVKLAIPFFIGFGKTLVTFGKVVVAAFAPIFTIPGLFIVTFTAITGAFIVFKETIIGFAKGTIAALANFFVNGFNDFVKVPFLKKLNDLINEIPDIVKDFFEIGDDIIEVGDLVGTNFKEDMGKVMKEAFAAGEQEARNFQTGVEAIFSSIKSTLGFGGEEGEGKGGGLVATMEEQFEKLKNLLAGVGKTNKDTAGDFQKQWKNAAENSKTAIADSVEEMVLNFTSLKDAVRSVANIIKNELMRALVAKPIAKGVGNFISNLLNPGGKAGGGNISGPTIVGERGPEIFNPSGAGHIVNNADSKKMLGAKGVTVIQNITFTADVQNSVRAEITNAAPILANMASEQVFDQIGRRGAG